MDSEADARSLGLLGRVVALTAFSGVTLLFTLVLAYMSVSPAWNARPAGGGASPEAYAIPIAMAAGGLLVLAGAVIFPRLVLRSLKRSLDGPKGLELYVTLLFALTAILSVGVAMAGFVGAFMLGASTKTGSRTLVFAYWSVTVALAALPILLAWPTAKRRGTLLSTAAGVGPARPAVGWDIADEGAVKDSIGSLRAYFLVAGALGMSANVLAMILWLTRVGLVPGLVNTVLAAGFLYEGARMASLIRTRPTRIRVLLYATMVWNSLVAGLAVLGSSAGNAVASVVVLAVCIYLLYSVRRIGRR